MYPACKSSMYMYPQTSADTCIIIADVRACDAFECVYVIVIMITPLITDTDSRKANLRTILRLLRFNGAYGRQKSTFNHSLMGYISPTSLRRDDGIVT